ncbi:unnamed protein product [Urochloa decumbens]|uniref:Protein kinase domain-containing protein n=1 Tax=Urochloa decumbens TaxID=240449 RepID=A0ABC9AKP4_9POAL
MKKPSDVPLPFLLDITHQFSDQRKLGSGGYGEVYKGVLDDGSEIAVKKLYNMPGFDDEQFKNEFNNLTRVHHQNIVRLIGYCDEVRHVIFKENGENLLAKMIYKVLCFEYMQGGSLEKFVAEEHRGLDWLTRYKIIKGICEGLDYLHGGLKEPIFHLDLKPANILLGKDMVPKIADFGLSRLFNGTQTHTTKVCIGTLNYMPPEYLQKRQISNKYDVFSLGVIIIEIMTGPMGFAKYAALSSPQQFVELVHNNWMERIGTTSKYAEQDCQQVKRCIEIALCCVEAERDKRPTIRHIIHELKKTETNGTASSWDKATLAKIGQWGGVGGGPRDIEVAPQRLESLTIRSGEVIYSLEFSYSDHSGQQHTAGPWGGHGPNKGSYHRTIMLDPSEYLLEISGTTGPFDRAPAGVITSLSFVTSAGSYGPFGQVRGTSFQVPVQSNGSIVGFFASAGWYVDSFGIYVNPKQESTKEGETVLAKIGPWGGEGGNTWDIKVAPHHLDSVKICSGMVVDSIEFSYHGHGEQMHTVGPWGSAGGSSCTDLSVPDRTHPLLSQTHPFLLRLVRSCPGTRPFLSRPHPCARPWQNRARGRRLQVLEEAAVWREWRLFGD